MRNKDQLAKSAFCVLSIFISFAGIGQTGPGGVGTTDGTSTLRYWVSASKGVTGATPVTAWSDLSGYNITNSIQGSPQLIASGLNGSPVVRFNGSGQKITTSLSINASTFPNLTVIAVYQPRIDNAGGVWGEDNGGWDRFLLDANGLNSIVSNGTGPTSNIPNIFPVGAGVITSIIFQENITNGTTVNANGTTQSTFTTNHNPQTSNNFGLASIGDGTSNYNFDGDIAEMIVFGTNINAAQRIIIDNYLSAKYGIPLTSGGIYTQGQTANGGFAFDVAGIGRIDASNINLDAQGSGMVEIRNPSDLNDNEFLFWGNDGGAAKASNTTDVPAGVQARFGRVWRVNERNTANTADVDVGNVDIRFDLTGLGSVAASDLRLLIDANNNGIFNDEVPISGATDMGSNVYQFTAVPGTSLANNSRFTIATVNTTTTPLPVKLLFFNAVANNNSVELRWATASEDNSDYFDVQRSLNGTAWESLTEIKAAGNSTNTLNYNTTDRANGITGDVDYRLRQVDLDGNSIYSGIQKVTIGGNKQLHVFPSPAQSVVYIQTTSPIEKIAGLFNMAGQNMLPGLRITTIGDEFYSIDVNGLPKGTYLLKTTKGATKIIKE
ncbi:MAG TPA: T9SS type A sorting domain-containing protein [Puia sp.]|nr:T9SS type A sorting domain-containing protein [Puia sp.]